MNSKRKKTNKRTQMSRTSATEIDTYRAEKRRKRENPNCEKRFEPPLSSQEDDDDRFFIIEKLLDRRINKKTNKEEYLVRWKNYNEDWDTWEPRNEIEKNAQDMIKNFGRQDKACDNNLHCICRRPYKFDQGGMIQCFHCYVWFHFDCIKMNIQQANMCLRYYCTECLKINRAYKVLYKNSPTNAFYD